MIDLHCHILPGVDDGPGSVADAVALAAAQVAAGVGTVVATPHVSWEYPGNTAARIAREVAALSAHLARAGIELKLVAGAEVALTRALVLGDDELGALRLGGGPWLLVEPPLNPVPSSDVAAALSALQDRGHRIVLAHPERCPVFLRDGELLERCVSSGMLVSVTASALVGRFGKTVQRVAVRLVEDGLVHDVASDAHRAGGGRPPGLRAGLERAGFGAEVARLCEQTPRAILEGTPIPPAAAGQSDVPARRLRLRRRARTR